MIDYATLISNWVEWSCLTSHFFVLHWLMNNDLGRSRVFLGHVK